MSEKRFDLVIEPCICGVVPQLTQHGWPSIKCYETTCGLTYYDAKHTLDVDAVVRRWNSRHLPPDVQAVIEAARRTEQQHANVMVGVISICNCYSCTAIRNLDKGSKP
jgi:hypothetical protein